MIVPLSLACASYLAGSAEIPRPVPDYALQAAEICRLEIGQETQKELDVLEKLRKACADLEDVKERLGKLEAEPLP